MKHPKSEYDHLYKPARTWDYINEDDPDLTPVFFTLPSPPPLHLIEGYGKHPDDQYFRRHEVPKKLVELEDRALKELYEVEKSNRQDTIQGYRLYLKYWELLENEADDLEKEIDWLKKVWWYRTYGYWFFNDGEPTFIPPEHYDFLNFYYIAESKTYPEYRDDIRRKACFQRYLMECTETFADISPETGRAFKVDGKYRMVDLGRRLFLGDIEPKTRRVGASHEGIHCILVGTITHESFFSTIISMDGQNAKALYDQKLLPAWDNYPMCLKPIWEGNRRPTTLKLSAPPNVYHVKGLNSTITCTESAGEKKSEGKRINRIHSDEMGKTTTAMVSERHHVNKLCMSTGMGINIIEGAYCKNPSTVEECDEGGADYQKLCNLSDFYMRIPSLGQTHEGLSRIFIPAFKRLEGYIDRFGKSVIDIPTERQIALSPHAVFAVSKKGARQMLQEQRDSLLQQGTPEAMEAYRSLRRKSPFNWAECWLGSAGNVGFNMEIIDKRLGEINREKSLGRYPYRRGYFYRENSNDPNSKVLWKDDNEKDKFHLSMVLPDQLTNQRTRIDRWDVTKKMFVPCYKPVNGHRFTIGADPFRNITKNEAKAGAKYGGSMSNSRQSDGGIGVNWEYDESIDRGKPREEWQTDRCVCTYRYRPESQMEYMEDVIMCMQYFGGMLYPETNVERLVEYVIERGYFGYLLYDTDILTGRPKAMPGRYTTNDTLQELFTEAKDYVKFRGMKDCHDDLLMEIKTIKGIEDATHKDLFVAYFYARLGSKSRHRDILSKGSNKGTFDISTLGMFKKRVI